MKKILITLLLVIGSAVQCVSAAQEINEDDKQKIRNYINCFYTAKYVQISKATTPPEKKSIKDNGIDTVSIDYAFDYEKLDSILTKNRLTMTFQNLTKKLNDRNKNINQTDVFLFIDEAVNRKSFEKFELTYKDECDLRNSILRWYHNMQKLKESYSQTNAEEVSTIQTETEDDKKNDKDFEWKYIVIGGGIFLFVIAYLIGYKSRPSTEEKETNYSPCPAPQVPYGIDKLKRENEELRQEKEELKKQITGLPNNNLKTEPASQEESKNLEGDSHEKQNENERTMAPNSSNSRTTSNIPPEQYPSIVYYADADINNNQFTRTSEIITKKSVYVIDINKLTFTLINDEHLYSSKLSKVNSSGILEACEVNGNYKNDKSVTITPGKVQKEENGKWRITKKAIIEIK